ncbi:hypothetical protein LQ948_02820 [Jiella sp. MQZ9-1]|uniref:Uncharacterized protein n=1 Tax=Jiella flava TaxID=2816857 RepID=A0A939FTY6_9HYPH|nr:hypothetical protein [Jiella flava]MBO0661497.1 hypothetical protein [Jiella flava]MCD2470139.1 hypothetical protein [Jiella flava]
MQIKKISLTASAGVMCLSLSSICVDAATIENKIIQAPSQTGSEHQRSDQSIETNSKKVIKKIISEFDPAVKSLDAANKALEYSIKNGDYSTALKEVDALSGNVNALADRVAPGNFTERRIKQIISNIDSISAQLRNDRTISSTFKTSRIESLSKIKRRFESGEQVFSQFYPKLNSLADELHRKREAVGYDIIISSLTQAAEQLDQTNEKIQSIIDGLTNYLSTIKEPLTN